MKGYLKRPTVIIWCFRKFLTLGAQLFLTPRQNEGQIDSNMGLTPRPPVEAVLPGTYLRRPLHLPPAQVTDISPQKKSRTVSPFPIKHTAGRGEREIRKCTLLSAGGRRQCPGTSLHNLWAEVSYYRLYLKIG